MSDFSYCGDSSGLSFSSGDSWGYSVPKSVNSTTSNPSGLTTTDDKWGYSVPKQTNGNINNPSGLTHSNNKYGSTVPKTVQIKQTEELSSTDNSPTEVTSSERQRYLANKFKEANLHIDITREFSPDYIGARHYEYGFVRYVTEMEIARMELIESGNFPPDYKFKLGSLIMGYRDYIGYDAPIVRETMDDYDDFSNQNGSDSPRTSTEESEKIDPKLIPIYEYPKKYQIDPDDLPSDTEFKWCDDMGGEVINGPAKWGIISPDGKKGHGGLAALKDDGNFVVEYHGLSNEFSRSSKRVESMIQTGSSDSNDREEKLEEYVNIYQIPSKNGKTRIDISEIPDNAIHKWCEFLGGEIIDSPVKKGEIRPDGKVANNGVMAKDINTGHVYVEYHGFNT